jgi:predicted transcriptional regulator of viral defense system
MNPKVHNLIRKQVFTFQEAVKLGVSASLLSYYLGKGSFKRLQQGVYQGIESFPVDFRWIDLVQAAYGVKEGVVCLLSALAVYELTDEIPRQHWIGVRHGTDAVGEPQLRISLSQSYSWKNHN